MDDEVAGKTIGGFSRVNPPREVPADGTVRVSWVTTLEPDELTREINDLLFRNGGAKKISRART